MSIKEELEDLKKMTDIISNLNNVNGNDTLDYSNVIKELENLNNNENFLNIYFKNTSNNEDPVYQHNDDSGLI